MSVSVSTAGCIRSARDGYAGRIDGIHAAELAERLKGAVYLDHGGCGLYTASHLSSTHTYLSQSLLLNPHSDPSTSTTIDQIRESVLSYLGTDSKQHSVIFTYNTSTAMNLLGSIFPFRAHSEVALTMDNHNSALGMREKVKACNARFSVVTPAVQSNAAKLMQCCCSPSLLSQHSTSPATDVSKSGVNPCLFIFPAESNFDGRIYDLSLAQTAHAYNYPLPAESSASTSIAAPTCSANPLGFHHVGPAFRWFTFLDASKFLITSPLNLSQHPHVDFATVSFYKMFGFPTGLAALIIKNSTAQELWGVPYSQSLAAAGSCNPASPSKQILPSLSTLRSYFSGGTLNAAIADEDFHVSKSTGKLHDLLEDGTIAFTTIISLPYGIQLFKTLNPNNIHAHASALANYLFEWLQQQRYTATNQQLCIFYGDRVSKSSSSIQFGATLNLNFLDQHGQVIGYKTVEKIATSNRIFIRSGSFCNPGACQQSYPISADQIRRNLQSGYACWEDGENLNGVVNGSVRISMGWCTRFEDVYKFQQFVLAEIMHIGQQTFISNLAADTQEPKNQSDHSTSGIVAAQISQPSPFPTLPSHFLTPSAPITATSASTVSLAPIVSSNSSVAPPSLSPSELPDSPFLLSGLTIYPIKSCAGVSVSKWFISSQGSTLFLDRELVLLDAYGVALSQKVLPSLQLIRPTIDLANKSMTLRAPNHSPITVSLTDSPSSDSSSTSSNASLCSMQVCGNAAVGYVYDSPNHAQITEWLTSVVGKYTCLARKSTSISWPTEEYLKQMELNAVQATDESDDSDSPPLPSPSPSASSPASSTNQRNSFSSTTESSALTSAASGSASSSASVGGTRSSFANEDDFLLVNAASVREVETRLHEYVANHKLLTPHPNDAHISPSRFRPNFVIDSCRTTLTAFAEDTWKHVFIGPFGFRVKGGCGRCVMVNVQPQTGITHDSDDESSDSEEWWPIATGMSCSASTD